MARREIQAEELGNLFTFKKHGDSLEGVYIGTRKVDGQYGRQTLYDVDAGNGLVLSAAGSAGLNPKMAKVETGTRVYITYVADKEMGKNRDGTDKNPMKVFKVEIDDGQAEQPQLAATGTGGKKAPF